MVKKARKKPRTAPTLFLRRLVVRLRGGQRNKNVTHVSAMLITLSRLQSFHKSALCLINVRRGERVNVRRLFFTPKGKKFLQERGHGFFFHFSARVGRLMWRWVFLGGLFLSFGCSMVEINTRGTSPVWNFKVYFDVLYRYR